MQLHSVTKNQCTMSKAGKGGGEGKEGGRQEEGGREASSVR